MRESKSGGYPLCFVDFLPNELEQAQVTIKGGMLPLGGNMVPNDVELGESAPNKMIIAGPNGAGKSIYLKMIGCNELLAHTLGIAVADSMSTSWFDAIRTCINPSESIIDGNSKLQAEKMRMDCIMDEFKYNALIKSSYKGLFIADEPLSGTRETIASDLILEDYQQMENKKQLAICMATHNQKLTELADRGNYANYQVCFAQTEQGLPEPTFRVSPGKPEWWFSDDPTSREGQKLFVRYTVALKQVEFYKKKLPQMEKVRHFYSSKLERYERDCHAWKVENSSTITPEDIARLEKGREGHLQEYQVIQAEVDRIKKLITQEQRKIDSWRG